MPELQIMNGPMRWRTITIEGPRFVIGRRDDCDLVLKDGWVSREHTLLVEVSPGRFVVQDLRSENGSFLNGRKITEAPLKDQDILRIGRTEMRFIQPDHTGAGPVTPIQDSDSDVIPVETPGIIRAAVESVAAESQEETFHDGTRRTVGTDLRERVRKLEKQLLKKEEEIAGLAAENAVIKRALAKAGLLGAIEQGAGGAAEPEGCDEWRFSRGLRRLMRHPRACLVFPSTGEPVVERGTEDPPEAPEALSWNILGLCAEGARLAGAFDALGHRRVLSLLGEGEDSRGLPEDALVRLPRVGPSTAAETVRKVLAEERLRLAAAIGRRFDQDADANLICTFLGEGPGEVVLGELVESLADAARLAGGAGGGPDTVLAAVLGEGRDEETMRGALSEVRVLFHAGRIPLLFFADGSRLEELARVAGMEDRGAHLLASVLDTVNRLAGLVPEGRGVDETALRRFFGSAGVASLGLGAADDATPKALEKALHYALDRGWLGSGALPALAREALVLVLHGKNASGGEPEVVKKTFEAVRAATQELLPQARPAVGIRSDEGKGVRVITCLGGLPFPGERST